MLIVADENIPLLDSFFGDIGRIHRVSGRSMTAEDVCEADILLVRSVTRVNQALLEGSRVKFVGTATIGTDHVDEDWLLSRGISFCAAPGCNANSVAEYVLSVLSLYAERRGLGDWSELTVGVVGVGNVGGELARKLDRLGFAVKLCDPPRAAAEEGDFVELEEALACDVVTLHTPLTSTGEHATHHLIDEARLSRLGRNQLLINTSRGGVIDESALLNRLAGPDAPTVALDVWRGEPAINPDLVNRVWLATPHIAGYSLEGKVQGSEMIYQSVCRYLGLPARKKAGQFLPEPALSKLAFTSSADEVGAAVTAMRCCYDPRRDDAELRRSMWQDEPHRRATFDRLRRDYPVRREFSSVKIQLKGSSRSSQDTFRALGFKLKI
ncbi:4-phosphoerythronate dehydrogenase PdxB [Marinobacter sp. SS21]|uniref:4-phosphoerythronate dehydrogenase PdxB n=1 Tax=Marinobacter sp. SS21 TaxID=2979460 RepID=UPI00232CD338|nr:4-phosphoerythronate dehydrogenase PdxB [Marinobacter sp. SS21]MDC0662047.1 4-phosphoerythronate dehydrogenase PdxB [Marinobacter sp. SS21]